MQPPQFTIRAEFFRMTLKRSKKYWIS